MYVNMSNVFYIKITPYWKGEPPTLETQTRFAFYILQCLKSRIQNSVETQQVGNRSMRSLYAQLSDNYKKRKLNRNKDKFWKDTEFLIDSLRVWQTNQREVNLGIPENIAHPKSPHTPAYMIFQWLEFGTGSIPARPLIMPHLRFILNNIYDYWLHYNTETIQKMINMPSQYKQSLQRKLKSRLKTKKHKNNYK